MFDLTPRRVSIYLFGVLIGCLVLFFIPRPEPKPEHPWHAQTAPEGYYPRTVTDDLGREVTVERQPRWVISLAPSVTEILFGMDMGDHLMAVTTFCQYPPEARELPKIGGMKDPDYEQILQKGADIVFGTEMSSLQTFQQLESLGMPAIAFKHQSFDDVIEDIASMGTILGVPGKALELINKISDEREAIEQRLEGVKPVSTLYLYGFDDLTTTSKGTWVADLIAAAGGKNIAASADSPWPRLQQEAILKANPETILVAVNDSNRAGMEETIAALPNDPIWKNVAAVQNHRVHLIDETLLQVPGPRMTQALRQLATALHPNRFEVVEDETVIESRE